jgi:hypothetical protein
MDNSVMQKHFTLYLSGVGFFGVDYEKLNLPQEL